MVLYFRNGEMIAVEEFEILNKINSPKDLKRVKDLKKLCEEIRLKIMSVVSKNGGHLASNLGAVELTVALNVVFGEEEDAIVWDVGHQCYAHKMITGRLDKIHTIRQKGGLSGFTNREESDYDKFTSGHSSTSISAAFGLAQAKNIKGEKGHVVAVIGDGALTGGLAYEGLNNAGRFKKNFVVVLNDNKMSISKNVGSIARHLACVRVRPSYMRLKSTVEKILMKTPVFGRPIRRLMLKLKSLLRSMLYKGTIFEEMGFVYYGPIDGHDTNALINTFKLARDLNKPVFIHVITTKGKGYGFAEKNPKKFHGISAFDVETGKPGVPAESFSDVFGATMCSLAEKDSRICGITAAMGSGTGLSEFAKRFKSRFFDVGIAEEHAITFAGGLSAGGCKPVFAVYSSFLQRGYDQIIHDAALQKLNVTFAIDRAGFVGEDGETHQGIFDVAFLSSIPNVTVYAPSFFDELRMMLSDSIINGKNVSAVRYPKGKELFRPEEYRYTGKRFEIFGDRNASLLIVTYGRLFSYACKAREELIKKGQRVCILKLNVIKPIDRLAIIASEHFSDVFFFEEGIKSGGVGEKFGYMLSESNFRGKYILTAIDDVFVKHAPMMEQIKSFGLDTDGMVSKVMTECTDRYEKKA